MICDVISRKDHTSIPCIQHKNFLNEKKVKYAELIIAVSLICIGLSIMLLSI
jgi:hypothetical protein